MTQSQAANRGLGVYVYGGFGVPNAGDEAILSGVSNFYAKHYPGSRLFVTTASPNYSSLFQPDWDTAHSFTNLLPQICANPEVSAWIDEQKFDALWDKIFARPATSDMSSHHWLIREQFARTNMIHVAGGGYLNQGFPQAVRICALLASIGERLDLPMIATGLTYGPFNGKTRGLMDFIMARIKLMDLRQNRNLEEAQSYAVGAGVSCDDAFLMSLSDRVRTIQKPRTPDGLLKVNIQMSAQVPAQLDHARELLTDTLKNLAEQTSGKMVVRALQYFPFKPSDFDAVAPVMSEMAAIGVAVEWADLSLMSTHEALESIAEGDVTVASRLHAAITSMLAGRPAYSLVFDHAAADRMHHVHNEFGSDNISTYSSTSVEQLSSAIMALVDDRGGPTIAEICARIDGMANQKSQMLAERVGSFGLCEAAAE